MEERYNWTGALIEASSINFGKLVTKKRKAILIPACLSLEKHPTTVYNLIFEVYLYFKKTFKRFNSNTIMPWEKFSTPAFQ